MKKPRIYVDTSVFGGVFDEEFKGPSLEFFKQLKNGIFTLVTSQIVRKEILMAPIQVGNFFESFTPIAEIVDVTEEAGLLSQAYLRAKIVGPKSMDDTLHVALATVHDCTLIVSWNFKHIVNFDKMSKYNAINLINGYKPVSIFSPREAIIYDD